MSFILHSVLGSCYTCTIGQIILVFLKRKGSAFGNETNCMQEVLSFLSLYFCFGSAAEYFRSKDYQMSAELFEKSMLYVPYDLENRILRAKGFRVLCLCHLGLLQLDRAQEYINEAEKVPIFISFYDFPKINFSKLYGI